MNDNINNQISKKLQFYLNTNRISLSELAERLEVPTSTVHGWLNGVEPKNIITIKKIANLMNKSLDELCFNEAPRTEHQDTDLVITIGESSFRISLIPHNKRE